VAPSPNYMSIQTELTWDMRGILVDWLVQVHQRFRLLPETLYLTVHLIDRFLSMKGISSSKLQLVGVVSLLIAAKMEEQYAPTIENLAFMTDNTYTKKDIVKAEQRLLVLMDFDIRYAQPMTFLRRISNADTRIRNLAKYLMEATLMDWKFVGQLPSFLAAASMCVARKVVMDGEWTTEHVRLSGYQEYDLIDCGRAILKLVSDIESHKAIYTKYSHERYGMVSIEMRHFLLRTCFVDE
jgi:G2/mitotic-specific cyclin 3/4